MQCHSTHEQTVDLMMQHRSRRTDAVAQRGAARLWRLTTWYPLCSQLKLSATHLMHVTDAPVLDPAYGTFSAATATQADHVKVLSRSLADCNCIRRS